MSNFCTLINSRRVLFVASIEKHIIRFHIPSLKWFKDRGYEVHVACNGDEPIEYADKIHQIDFIRSPFSLGHFRVLSQLKGLMRDYDFGLVHCHTAMASVLMRVVCLPLRKSKKLALLYTAHGFHFFKGSPLYYWLLYYPIEKFFSKFADCIITINQEDFALAKKHFYCQDIRKIPGMGVNAEKFIPLAPSQRSAVRKEIGLPSEAKLLIYPAEFITRKNHRFLINHAYALKEAIPDLHILLPGRGKLLESIKELAQRKKVNEFVHFLGFRNDISQLIGASDIAFSCSKQEGLGLHLAEAMMCGLPVVASMDRGHKEMIEHGLNGFFYEVSNPQQMVKYVTQIMHDENLRKKMAEASLNKSVKFSLANSIEELGKIYLSFLPED